MTRSFRIMLADPPVARAAQIYPYPAIGLLYLAGAVRQAFPASDVEIRYQNAFCQLREHIKAIEDYHPHLYGMSFTTALAVDACRALKAVRAAFPALPIITGGAHPSCMPEDVLNNSPADACFVGECERSFVEFLSQWRDGRCSFESTPGVVFRQGSLYQRNSPAPVVADIDEFAWPAWDLVTPGQFPGFIYQKGFPCAGVVASRGCPWQCNFCSKPLGGIPGGAGVRFRKPERIIEEVEYLYQQGIREIRLFADELNANVRWACSLLKGLAALNHHDLYFNCNLRGDFVTAELADAMREANLWLVNIGIESASQRTLDGVCKKIRTDQVESTCALLKSRGITVFGNFILYPAWESAGQLQYEDTHDAHNTIAYAARLRRRKLIDYMSISVSTPRPTSPLWDLAKQHNLFSGNTGEPFHYMARGMSLPGISKSEVARTLLLGRAVQAAMALAGSRSNLGIVTRALRKRSVWMGSDVSGSRKRAA